jgi:Zn-dependent protease
VSSFDLRTIVLNLILMLLSLSVHEFAHAFAATRLGDDTPSRQGRLTLSPLAHYDLFGTIIIPVVATFLTGFALIGWAKPVEFNPLRLTRKLSMRQGSAIVAVAGPFSNFVLALLAAIGLAVLQRTSPELTFDTGVGILLYGLFQVNVGLCVFNMIPLPPLDGSYLLPRRFDEMKAAIAPYSFFLIIALLNIDVTNEYLFRLPVRTLSGLIESLFGVI